MPPPHCLPHLVFLCAMPACLFCGDSSSQDGMSALWWMPCLTPPHTHTCPLHGWGLLLCVYLRSATTASAPPRACCYAPYVFCHYIPPCRALCPDLTIPDSTLPTAPAVCLDNIWFCIVVILSSVLHYHYHIVPLLIDADLHVLTHPSRDEDACPSLTHSQCPLYPRSGSPPSLFLFIVYPPPACLTRFSSWMGTAYLPLPLRPCLPTLPYPPTFLIYHLPVLLYIIPVPVYLPFLVPCSLFTIAGFVWTCHFLALPTLPLFPLLCILYLIEEEGGFVRPLFPYLVGPCCCGLAHLPCISWDILVLVDLHGCVCAGDPCYPTPHWFGASHFVVLIPNSVEDVPLPRLLGGFPLACYWMFLPFFTLYYPSCLPTPILVHLPQYVFP